MKYVDEFRDGTVARGIADQIAREARPERTYRFMEFCGGQTHTLWRFGIVDMLPKRVEMSHGPGSPVCVLPLGRIEQAIELSRRPNVTLCTFGEMLRVPARDKKSLLKSKADGADIRVVHGVADALRFAEDDPSREYVFFATGFEASTPATAVIVKRAAELGLENFSVFCNHLLTPPAMAAVLAPAEPGQDELHVDGFLAPGEVSTIIGSAPYERFARDSDKPVVVSGCEPLDLLQSILMLVRQVNEGRHEVENEYSRAVAPAGNTKAIGLVDEVFELRPTFSWRGLGVVPLSALRLRAEYAAWDAEKKWGLPYEDLRDPKACGCSDVVRTSKSPADCKMYGTACLPESPAGPCMVSPEGSCAAHYAYGRLTHAQPAAADPEDTES
jgi:hydrogenase expression/formation protein HypD